MSTCHFYFGVIMKIETSYSYLLRQDDYPSITYYCLWGEYVSFAHPLPYLWSSASAVHLLITVQMSICLSEQLLPGNWITGEENSCYPNSSLPRNLWIQSIIFSARAPCLQYFNKAQNIWVLFYSNPPGGRAGNFSLIPIMFVWNDFSNWSLHIA